MSNYGRLFVEKVLRIKPDRYGLPRQERVTRGESIMSNYTDTQPFVEHDPSVKEFIKEYIPDRHDIREYFVSLVPFTKWIMSYNVQWLIGDLVAGITVGAVVVPQSMAYAGLAQLPPQYGLYSSFVGVIVYWFFATSKDITIGPVAVMSTLVGDIIIRTQQEHPELDGPTIASALALLAGCFVFALGILRLGFIVDFIPLVTIASFMTGSAINIACGQFPTLFGINKLFNTRAPTYWVIIHFFQHLGSANLNTAIGMTALFLLYLIRSVCNQCAKRYPTHKRLFFFISTLRTAFTILLYTMISWLVNRHHRSKPLFSILGKVPRGFKAMGVPVINKEIITSFAAELPVTVIVLLIEHIAISKSFGRVNNYRIDPSQELIAIGFTNIWAPFFGGYPSTGSFSRTAIKSKAGVRTPFAGVITGIVVVLALYALPAVFFYIPNAGLSAVIIHAVLDLITPPPTIYAFWRINPLEVIIYFAGVIVTIFSSIENGIYVSIGLSGGLMLWRMAKPNGDFLGRVRVTTVTTGESRNIYKPLDRAGTVNPALRLEQPHPGVFVFSFNSDFIYPNVNHYIDKLVWHVLDNTRSGTPNKYARLGDRPWNDPKPRPHESDPNLPELKAVIYDMTAVSNVDVTSVQVFVDVKKQLDRHAAPNNVYFHFAGIRSAWTRRALASVGFGHAEGPHPVFSVANAGSAEVRNEKPDDTPDTENGRHFVPVTSVDRPTFNTDLDEALEMALINIGAKEPRRRSSFDGDLKEGVDYPSPKPPQSGFSLNEAAHDKKDGTYL